MNQHKMVDMRCPGNPKVKSDVTCCVIIPDKVQFFSDSA